MAGTPFFASPEMLNNRQYTYNNDVWQLGITLYHFATLALPYPGNDIKEILKSQKEKRLDPFPNCYSHELKWILT